MYDLPEEHQLLRQTVRELAEAKIAPAAADVDATGRFPAEALDALSGAGLHAAHIPQAHGGEGADALAAVIIIEEVARVCAASSLIPAVNKLGTVPVLLSGSERLKQACLPPVARGEALFSYALSEAGAGSDAASMRTRAVRNGDWWVLNGTKMWISNAGATRGSPRTGSSASRGRASRRRWRPSTTPGSRSRRRPIAELLHTAGVSFAVLGSESGAINTGAPLSRPELCSCGPYRRNGLYSTRP